MSKLKLQATDGNGGTVSLKGPASTTGNAEFELTLPGNAGSNGQVLATNGSGVLTWSNDANVGGATGVDFNDSVKARWGTGNDLEIYHNGTHSYIKNKTGDFYLQATDTEIGINILPNSRVELYYDNSKKFETSSTGGILRGTLWTAVDNTKIAFGTGDDLQIYHDGSTSRIKHDGTGDLSIQANKLWLGNSGLTEVYAELTQNGAVELRYDNSKKLETNANGIDVSGQIQVDDNIDMLTDNRYIRLGADADLIIGHSIDNSCNLFRTTTSNLKISFQKVSEKYLEMNPDSSIDLYFDGSKKLETLSDGVHLDGDLRFDNNRVIKTNSSGNTLQIQGGATNQGGTIQFRGGNSDGDIRFFAQGASSTLAERMRIESGGNINIPNDSVYFRIGADNDIQLYHISGVNYWKNQGSTVFKMVDTGGDTQIECNNNDTTKLFYNGSEKFYTTSGGTCTLGNMYAEAGGICQTLVHTGTGEIARFRANTSSTVGNITVSASSTTYNTSSDYRLKENTVPLSDGITRLKTLKPYRFNFKVEPSKTVDGFFAHEVTPAVPEAITGEKDASEMQQIDQSKLVPLLTAALQEAIGRIEELETKVAALGG